MDPPLAVQFRSLYDLHCEYELREKLGRGQFGVVWRCVHRATGEQLACKSVAGTAALTTTSSSRSSNSSGGRSNANRPIRGVPPPASSSERAIQGVRREIKSLARLYGCPHVVTLRAVFEDRATGSLYLVEELGSGGDLLTLIERRRRLGESDARRIFRDVVAGVKECHDRGIVHRDIKPDNILLCRQTSRPRGADDTQQPSPCRAHTRHDRRFDHHGCGFTAKLADFGVSRRVSPGRQHLRGYAGSFPYEAPEVVSGRPYDQSADIWSLGVTLYAMLSGKWPAAAYARGENWGAEASSSYGRSNWRVPCWWFVSRRAKQLIRRMMATDGRMRPSAAEILNDPWLNPSGCSRAAVQQTPSPYQTVSTSTSSSSAASTSSTASSYSSSSSSASSSAAHFFPQLQCSRASLSLGDEHARPRPHSLPCRYSQQACSMSHDECNREQQQEKSQHQHQQPHLGHSLHRCRHYSNPRVPPLLATSLAVRLFPRSSRSRGVHALSRRGKPSTTLRPLPITSRVRKTASA